MKHYRLLVPVILALLVSSCASQKRAWYLQDANPFTPEQIAESGQIRIKPLDRLTVVVNSKDPELAVPFNSSTSLSSVTGVASYSSATNQSLQIRTVDENGMLDMPVIGKIDCKGKTRSELAQAIADKIVEGGYINDPSVNVQFADMKISVIGEVARPGHYDVTRDKISIFDALAMRRPDDLRYPYGRGRGPRSERRAHDRIPRPHVERPLQLAGVLHPAERRDLRQAQ